MNRKQRLGSGIITMILSGYVGLVLTFTTGPHPQHWPLFGSGILLVLGAGLWFSGRMAERRRQRRPRTSRRTPGTQTGSVTVGDGLVLNDGRTKKISHSSIAPRPSTGTLPVAIDMAGLSGHREVEGAERWVWSAATDMAAGETWVWTASDVAVVGQNNETITCRVGLVIDLDDGTTRELHRITDHPITVEPGKPAHESFEFRLPLVFVSEDVRLDPTGCPRELVFMEIGGRERQRRVSFRPTPHRSWWSHLSTFWRRQPGTPHRSTVSMP